MPSLFLIKKAHSAQRRTLISEGPGFLGAEPVPSYMGSRLWKSHTTHNPRQAFLKEQFRDFLGVVQWLELCTSTAGGTGLIPGWGTKIPHSTWCSKKNNSHTVKFTL